MCTWGVTMNLYGAPCHDHSTHGQCRLIRFHTHKHIRTPRSSFLTRRPRPLPPFVVSCRDRFLTPNAQICYELCTDADAGYTFFGLQYSHECWCSSSFSAAEETPGATCDLPCSQNADELCGGFDAIMAYSINVVS